MLSVKMKVEKKYILRHRSSHNFYHPCTISQKATEGYAPSTKRVNKEKQKELFSENRGDFPGSPVVKNPPSNVGDVGSIPGWGAKIPHAMGQLSPMPQLESPLALESMLHKRFPATEPVQRRKDPV